MENPMIQFALQVKKMRAAQSKYFQWRSSEALKNAKHLEAEVDKTIIQILNPGTQTEMFESSQTTVHGRQ